MNKPKLKFKALLEHKKMNTKQENRFVDMTHVIGQLAVDYGVPVMQFDQLVELGKRAVIVYGLQPQAKSIPFADLCAYIIAFINTPFGRKALQEALQNS